MWVRGLKLQLKLDFDAPQSVAPHVGAWIETKKVNRASLDNLVAPHVGAWIETLITIFSSELISSRTPCGCVD